MQEIIVLSLFDGMSCGQIALKQLGFKVLKYYASEIDKFAIKQTQHNFPNTIQLGDIENWRTWDIDWKNINLLLAGSPCQGFSFAGKQLAFDDPRSKLFFVFVDILNHIKALNPDVKFLLENVNMKRSHMEVITRYIGIFPVNIDSSLVSAQNRNRWYWTNIRTKQVGLFGEIHSDIPQPKDRKILLRDILESEVDEKYFISQAVIDRVNRKKYSNPSLNPNKAGTLNTKNNSGQMSIDSGTTFISIDGKAPTQRSPTGRSLDEKHNFQFIKIDKDGNVKKNQDKASCFTAGANSGGNHSDMDLIAIDCNGKSDLNKSGAILSRYSKGVADFGGDTFIIQRERGFNKGGLHKKKAPTLSSNAWEQNNLLCIGGVKNGEFVPGVTSDFSQGESVYSVDRKSTTINSVGGGLEAKTGLYEDKSRIRRLTPTEASRLQTIPEWYEWIVSDTQIYKMCGNGWTVEVVMWILGFMETVKIKSCAV